MPAQRWGRRRPDPGASAPSRRSGPPDEDPWWDARDQELAEAPLLHRSDLAKHWRPAPMVNNVERLDPLGDDPASEAIRSARRARVLTALDEGRAWRRHRDGALLVARVEVFADRYDAASREGGGHAGTGDGVAWRPAAAHRAAWQEQGAASLDATWRQRWTEREVQPGWIEATRVPPAERPDPLHAFRDAPVDEEPTGAVDWFRVEDHTDLRGKGRVTIYEHLSLWIGRGVITLTVRHDLEEEAADVAAAAAGAVLRRWSADPVGPPSG